MARVADLGIGVLSVGHAGEQGDSSGVGKQERGEECGGAYGECERRRALLT